MSQPRPEGVEHLDEQPSIKRECKMAGLNNPFGGKLINIESGTLEDYYAVGGHDEDIPDYLALTGRRIYNMTVRSCDRIQFEVDVPGQYGERLQINAWALRVNTDGIPDDFRFCATLDGITQQCVLRGWNQ